MVLALGLLAFLSRQPLLFPSLAPTIFIQVHAPRSEAARPWNTLAGHGLGVAAAVLSLMLLNAGHSPPLAWRREVASAMAVGLATAGQTLLRAAHPPGVATALLITLGAILPETRAILVIAGGVTVTVALERLLRPWLLSSASTSPERRAGQVGQRD